MRAMVLGGFGRTGLRLGFSVVAALMISTSAWAQDAGTDEATGPEVDVVQNWHDLNPGDGLPDGTDVAVDPMPTEDDIGDGTDVFIDVGIDEDPADGGTDDQAVDDGSTDGGEELPIDDGLSGGDGGDGTDENPEILYTMFGGVADCIDCNVIAYSTGASAGPQAAVPDVLATSETTAHADAAAPVKRKHKSSALLPMTSASADCLVEHARLPWLCEWQNGAGQ